MRLFALVLLLFSNIFISYSQEYDLIVRVNGDSIACYIDSVTENQVYFEMKNNSSWINTNISKDAVSSFKYKAIRKGRAFFIPGTSILSQHDAPSIKDIPTGSILITTDFLWSITANYEKLITLNHHFGIMLRGGIGITGESDDPNPLVLMTQLSGLYGTRNHFAELGIGYYQTPYYLPSFFPMVGYRYMGIKGLAIKVFLKAGYYKDQDWIDEWGQGKVGTGIQIGYRFWLK